MKKLILCSLFFASTVSIGSGHTAMIEQKELHLNGCDFLIGWCIG